MYLCLNSQEEDEEDEEEDESEEEEDEESEDEGNKFRSNQIPQIYSQFRMINE